MLLLVSWTKILAPRPPYNDRVEVSKAFHEGALKLRGLIKPMGLAEFKVVKLTAPESLLMEGVPIFMGLAELGIGEIQHVTAANDDFIVIATVTGSAVGIIRNVHFGTLDPEKRSGLRNKQCEVVVNRRRGRIVGHLVTAVPSATVVFEIDLSGQCGCDLRVTVAQLKRVLVLFVGAIRTLQFDLAVRIGMGVPATADVSLFIPIPNQ
jgi:hypothetical protein